MPNQIKMPWSTIWWISSILAIAVTIVGVNNAVEDGNSDQLKNPMVFISWFLAMWATFLVIFNLLSIVIFVLSLRLEAWLKFRTKPEKPSSIGKTPTSVRRGRKYKRNGPPK